MPAVVFTMLIWCFGVSVGLGGDALGRVSTAEIGAESVPAEVVARVQALRQEVAYHDDLYFKKAAPEISDYDYDRLKAELRRLEAAYPDIPDGEMATVAPAAVGDDRDGAWPTARHRVRMGSLDKVFTAEELAAFHARVAAAVGHGDVRYAVEPKFDGVAISLTYEAGQLVRAVTRGNGEEGDEVTSNVREISGLPPMLGGSAGDAPAVVELRGEIYLTHAAFDRINAAQRVGGEPEFANPRNLAAGTLKQSDPAVVASRGLSLVLYAWGAWEPEPDRPRDLAEFRARVQAWGLPALPETREAVGLAAMQQAVTAWQEARGRLAYPTDGVVVKVADVAEQDRLGEGPAAPRWAVAYKFAPDRATTRLSDVVWQVGRTGVLTPVAEFAPVTLAGTTVSRATLHHAARFEAWDLREGDAVVVEKAGEIIPAVVGIDLLQRVAAAAPYRVPTVCPSCGAPLQREGDALDVRCENAACPAQLARRLVHFGSRAGMDIDGLGPAMAEQLVAQGLVASPPDLYRLTTADLVRLPGVAEVSGERLVAAIAASRARDLARVIVGLGVPGVGPAGAADMAKRWANLVDFAAQETAVEPIYRAWAQDLVALGVVGTASAASAPTGGSMAGEVVVFTGGLASWTRAEATQRVEAAGGVVESRLTGRTTLVVAGEKAGSTLAQAQERGLPVIDEAALRLRLEP